MNTKYNMFDLFTASFIHTKKILFGENRKKIWLYFLYALVLSGVFFGIDPDITRLIKFYVDMLKEILIRYGLANEDFSFNIGSVISCLSLNLFNFDFDKILNGLNKEILIQTINTLNISDLDKYINQTFIYLGIFTLISVILIFFCIFRGKLMLIYSISSNREESYDWKNLWNKFASSGNYTSFIFSLIFCFCLFLGWLIGNIWLYPNLNNFVYGLLDNVKNLITLEANSKNILSTSIHICSFSICSMFFLSFFYLLFVFYTYFILPIILKIEHAEKIKWFEEYKKFWDSLKVNFWNKILNIILFCIIIFAINTVLKMSFGIIQLTLSLIFSISDIFVHSYASLILYAIFYLIIQLPIILFLNIPVGVYYTTLQIMMFSYIFPEHALIKPIFDENEKMIDTECLLM